MHGAHKDESCRSADTERRFINSVGNKDLKKLQKKAWNAGWWPERKKSGILWLAPQDGHVMLHTQRTAVMSAPYPSFPGSGGLGSSARTVAAR
jgi:hypothetical protein